MAAKDIYKNKKSAFSASVRGIITDALVIFAYRQVILLKAVIFCYAKLYLPVGKVMANIIKL